MTREGYCPECFARIPIEAGNCPVCGADIAALNTRDCRDKLLSMVDHPLADIRLRAIIALGLRADEQATDALAACALSHQTHVIAGLAIVDSLRRMPRAAAQQALARR